MHVRPSPATRRRTHGTVTNGVFNRVERRSPVGFEFGYDESSPSDLALNAVEHLIQHLSDEGAIEEPSEYYLAEEGDIHAGRVSRLVFQLAPDFKAKFVAPMPTEGATIEYEVLKEWVVSHPKSQPR